jgi:hypothetical protein
MICYACQNGSIKQSYINNLSCEKCKASWVNNMLPKSMSTTSGYAGLCLVCNGGQLKQDYPNTIQCTKCNTKWTNNNLSQFGKNQKSYYASKHRESRK